MNIFRSYISKGNTIIRNNRSNNSQNPVAEISYGTEEQTVSRYIFDINLTNLISKIINGEIKENTIQSHKLRFYNTIGYYDNVSTLSYSSIIERANSFTLELFSIDQDWDEGIGYDFNYIDLINDMPVNWYDRKTNTPWSNEGIYTTGSTIIASQRFQKGSEHLEIDITDYVNNKINEIIISGQTGTTFSYGIGIKFTNDYESLITVNRQAVAFYTNKTHSFYEPHVETQYDITFQDDRYYFFQDKVNRLYLTVNPMLNITVDSVDIYDNNENFITSITGSSIIEQTKGVFYINYNVDSLIYPDNILFTDRWNILINSSVEKEIIQDFYVKNNENYLTKANINLNNYHINVKGILENEKISSGEIKKIKINIKKIYADGSENLPLNIEYRVFVKQTESHIIEVIPYNLVNRIGDEYEILLDTSWLIPQDYYLEMRISNYSVYEKIKPIRFKILSEKF